MNIWRERLQLFKHRGNSRAALFWILKKIIRLEIHFLYAIDLNHLTHFNSLHKREKILQFHFVAFNTTQDSVMVKPDIIDQIELQSGWSVESLLENNVSVYALLDQANVVTQTNIYKKTRVHVDSPTHLDILLRIGDAFLGFLYTHPPYRGWGTAPLLIKRVCEDVKKQGYQRIVTHIRATNAPSLNTFNKCGWSRVGWILTSTNGRLLMTHAIPGTGVTVSESKRTI